MRHDPIFEPAEITGASDGRVAYRTVDLDDDGLSEAWSYADNLDAVESRGDTYADEALEEAVFPDDEARWWAMGVIAELHRDREVILGSLREAGEDPELLAVTALAILDAFTDVPSGDVTEDERETLTATALKDIVRI